MTVSDLLQVLETIPGNLPVYGSCCSILRIDPGIAIVNLIAPRTPGRQLQGTRYTVAELSAALTEVGGDKLLHVNGVPAQTVDVDADDQGQYVDVWAG
jgi:hypothetical protein